MAGRFSFSVPERRHAGDPWFRIGQLDVTTTVLVTALSVAGIVLYALSSDLWFRLVLDPAEVRSGEVWRLLTWPLANEVASSIWPVITIAIFWYFGREVEGRLGRSRFAVMLLLLAVVPGVVATVIDVSDYGLSAVQFGVFLVFVADSPYARFFFGIPAWVLAAVLVAFDVIRLLSIDEPKRIVVLVASIATALVTARSMGMARSVTWIPALPSGGGRSSRPASRPRRKPASRRGDVVSGPWGTPARTSPTSLPQPPGADAGALADQAELDGLLDKIAAGGMDSLSSDEKRRLNELSKRMRNR